jgi:hypothetical protein
MTLTVFMPWISAALIASVAAVLASAALGRPEISAIATGSFALAIVAVGWSVNRPFWRLGHTSAAEGATPVAARRNARLMALTYSWGAIAMLTAYTLTGLRWYHAWQYGLAMALLGGLLFLYAVAIGREGSRLRQRPFLVGALQLATVQGAAALGGVLFLIGSGKLGRPKADWAANHIFLAGGVAIVALSAIAAATQRKLRTAEGAGPKAH